MTEDEAKTKWCCGPKIISDQLLAGRLIPAKLHNPPDLNGTCVGSACMAWRAEIREFNHVTLKVGEAGEQYTEDKHGYCGLAGCP